MRYSFLLVVAMLLCLATTARGSEIDICEADTLSQQGKEAGKNTEISVQEIHDIAIYYEHDRAWPRWDYASNRLTYEILTKAVYQLSRQLNNRAMVIQGAASPIGSDRYNANLAMRRAQVLRDIVTRMEGGANIYIEVRSSGEDWDSFQEYVEANYDKPNRDRVIEILRKKISNDDKERELKALDKHKTWRLLVKEYMATARNAAVIRFVEKKDLSPKKPLFKPLPPLVLSDLSRAPFALKPILKPIKWPERKMRTTDFTSLEVYRGKADVIETPSWDVEVNPLAEGSLERPLIFTAKQDVAEGLHFPALHVAEGDMSRPLIFTAKQDVAEELHFPALHVAEGDMSRPSIFTAKQDVVEELHLPALCVSASDILRPSIFTANQSLVDYSAMPCGVGAIASSDMLRPNIFANRADVTAFMATPPFAMGRVLQGDLKLLPPIFVPRVGINAELDMNNGISWVNFADLMLPHTEPITKIWRKPVVAIRSNLLVPALNIGVEVPIKTNWSVGADYYFPWIWPKKDNKNCFELLTWGVEGRYWFGKDRTVFDRLQGHSVGVYGYMGYYDFERNFQGQQGEFVNFGVDYTYAMAVGKKKAIHFEFSIGLGFIHSQSRKYSVIESAGPLIDNKITRKMNFFGPTKANVSLVVPIFKRIKVEGEE